MRWGALGGGGFRRLHQLPSQLVPPVPRRLEKEYAAIKNKEMEEQIEIKVGWGRDASWGCVPSSGPPAPSPGLPEPFWHSPAHPSALLTQPWGLSETS